MKNKKRDINQAVGRPIDSFTDLSSADMMEDVIGTKVLYNWLYQKEEEAYYLSSKVSDFFPDFVEEEALFVEY